MIYRLDFEENFADDSQDAYDWYENTKPGLGERFFDAMGKTLEQITKNPEAFSEKSKNGYREASLNIFPYRIAYKIYKKSNTILINSIYHTSRNP